MKFIIKKKSTKIVIPEYHKDCMLEIRQLIDWFHNNDAWILTPDGDDYDEDCDEHIGLYRECILHGYDATYARQKYCPNPNLLGLKIFYT